MGLSWHDDGHPVAIGDGAIRRLAPHRLGDQVEQGLGPQRRHRLAGHGWVAVVGGPQQPVNPGIQGRVEQRGILGGEVAARPAATVGGVGERQLGHRLGTRFNLVSIGVGLIDPSSDNGAEHGRGRRQRSRDQHVLVPDRGVGVGGDAPGQRTHVIARQVPGPGQGGGSGQQAEGGAIPDASGYDPRVAPGAVGHPAGRGRGLGPVTLPVERIVDHGRVGKDGIAQTGGLQRQLTQARAVQRRRIDHAQRVDERINVETATAFRHGHTLAPIRGMGEPVFGKSGTAARPASGCRTGRPVRSDSLPSNLCSACHNGGSGVVDQA